MFIVAVVIWQNDLCFMFGHDVAVDVEVMKVCHLKTLLILLFCYVGPSTWNAVTYFFKNDTLSLSTFRRQLKNFYFSLY